MGRSRGDSDVTAGDRRARLRQALLDYAERQPSASDTFEGVRGFWVPESLQSSEADLEFVLTELVALGVLTTKPLPDGSALYAVSRRFDRETQ